MEKQIAFIPLRKGSKGIPGKNCKLLGGKPLFCWILDSLAEARISDEIWIATDCDKVKTILKERYPDIFIFNRSDQSARDESPTLDVVKEFLSFRSLPTETIFMLFQATSPFVSCEELEQLHQIIAKGGYDSWMACERINRFRWDENGVPLDYSWKNKPRRQDYRGFLVEAGAFYITTVAQLLKTGELISGKVKLMELSRHSLIDIDEPFDWFLAESYVNYIQKSND